MSSWLPGLLGAVLAAGLIAVSNRTLGAARKNAEGWKVLRPGWFINLTLALTAGFAALMSYVFPFVGSALPDAEAQMAITLLLAVGTWLVFAYLGWTSYGRTVMWKGNELRVRTVFGGDRVRRIPDVCRVRKNETLGEYVLTFRDGSRLRLPAQLHGANELVERLPKRARD